MTSSSSGLAKHLPRLIAALALVAAGCGGPVYGGGPGTPGPSTSVPTVPPSTPPSYSTPPPSTAPTYTLTVYWSFARHVRGQAQPVVYDLQPGPGGTASGACAQSGVDTVSVSEASGAPLTAGSGVSCVYGGVQGASFPGFIPGTYDLVVTGYRASHALYETPIRVDVVAGGQNAFDVSVPGIPDDLDVFALFLDTTGVETWTTCALAVVDTLQYQLVDSAGTTVSSGSTACADPAGLSFQTALSDGIDRDTYTISMWALDRGAAVFDATPPRCAVQVFDHLATDSLGHGWSVGLSVTGTVCR